ncbi:MAG: orotidine-5'-phosphate decarboxylase [Clostridiales bacterium]|nr:orotidine-5'-phosphate decarboxylase [Clostridiales bacterium]
MALDRLMEAIRKKDNPTVAGLDPRLEYLPEYIKQEAFREWGETLEGAAAAILRFNQELIDALCDIVPAVKPQAAYYELFGWPGMRALCETIAYAHAKGLFVITDGKRNDIGSTMEAYAAAHLGETMVADKACEAFGGDALTVNGYLGMDGIRPLLEVCRRHDRGLFVLVKTSNPSSGELQDLRLESGETIYRRMGALCETWGEQLPGKYGYSGVGAVVGATWPEQLTELRRVLPHTFFLVPGYGAQGGGASDVAGAFDSDGMGAVVNSSRALLCAWQKEGCPPEDFAGAARREALRMKEALASVR